MSALEAEPPSESELLQTLPDPIIILDASGIALEFNPAAARLFQESRELSVGELAEALATSQQNVSKHLGVLHRAGLVAREKVGNSVRCRIADESVMQLCELVCGGLQRQVAELQALLDPSEVTS